MHLSLWLPGSEENRLRNKYGGSVCFDGSHATKAKGKRRIDDKASSNISTVCPFKVAASCLCRVSCQFMEQIPTSLTFAQQTSFCLKQYVYFLQSDKEFALIIFQTKEICLSNSTGM